MTDGESTKKARCETRASRRRIWTLWVLGSFALAVLHFSLLVRPGVFCCAAGAVQPFAWTWDLLRTAALSWAGLATYLGWLVSDTFRAGLPGALAASAVLVALGVVTAGACNALSARRSHWLIPLVVVLGLLPFGSYTNFLACDIAITLAVGAGWLYTCTKRLPVWGRFLIGTTLIAALSVVAGAAALLFAVMAAMAEFRRKRERWLVPFLLAAGVCVPVCLVSWICALPWAEARRMAMATAMPWGTLPHGSGWTRQMVLLSLYPIGLVAILFSGSRGAKRLLCLPRLHVRPLLRGILIVAAAACALFYSVNWDLRRRIAPFEAAARGDWPTVLSKIAEVPLPQFTVALVSLGNKALLKQGMLLDEMFALPQTGRACREFILQTGFGSRLLEGPMHRHLALMHHLTPSLDLELGLVNRAEYTAHETWHSVGMTPRIARELAMINILKGRPEAAAVYLHRLGQFSGRAAESRALLKELRDDPAGDLSPSLSMVRARMLPEHAQQAEGVRESMLALLDANSRNRPAADLLLADSLLDKNLDRLIQDLPRLREAGYTRLPRHCQEAVLLHGHASGESPLTGDWEIAGDVQEQFLSFISQLPDIAGIPGGRGDLALYPTHGDTYYWYYCFRR